MAGGTAGSGYFGKLPARADFVTGSCPAGFLRLWEPFLIQGLAQSRLELKDAWEEAYMTMPLWRFWVKPTDGGRLESAVAGVFMPNVDRVGRKFPLTVVAPVNPAEQEGGRPVGDWYEATEAILLQTLREDAGLDGFRDAVDGLGLPAETAPADAPSGTPELAAMEETGRWLSAGFRCRAGDREYAFACAGLPHATAFRWLILPENHGGTVAGDEDGAGTTRGLYHPEDSRT
ncbi:type VI secretion system-associated protein TagF [Labrenzia sp. 011]|uniref:type VI secretion system-associated protein TagF n=1 Tax=Labrenzia sp. 011 TaxID=2171494 RepID=UPI000D5090B4|nr:type VI secretion system-associated protein TagF [Labrenzia sp. 011]PVB63591.1 type VI secretion system-associated protein TagF [Labrenzia sp. 011]